MRHPDVILIYDTDDHNYQAFGGHWINQEWRCSKVIPLPAADIDGFLAEMRQMGRMVIDLRRMGDPLLPVMAIREGFPLEQAASFAAHMAALMLKSIRNDAQRGGAGSEDGTR